MSEPTERQPMGLQLALAERERQYSPSSVLADGDYGPYVEAYLTRSDATRDQQPLQTVVYGPEPANTIDLVIPTRSSAPGAPLDRPLPVHLFIHGGYWQELSKHESLFSGREFANRGVALAAVDYTLAPAATLDEIVDECCAAIRTIRTVAPDLGLDADCLTVSGSSAGAHLAAMSTLRLAAEDRPRGLILVSGVYLLEALVGTTINEAVGLDRPSALALSPLRHPVDGFPPTIVAYGDNETDEFKRQSRAMVDALTDAGVAVSEVELPDRNHFDAVFEIGSRLVDLLDLLTG